MESPEIIDRAVLNERRLTELADQVDPAIGEASSMIGAMTAEIMRRSLRGGVVQIGRELSAFVGQEVDLQIAEQRPLIEKTAAITATEVARGEVEAVRHAASEQAERLSARIDDATRLAQEEAKIVARDLAGRLEVTSRLAQEHTQSVARDFTGRLEETSKKAHEKIEIVAKAADDTARQTNEVATSLSRLAPDGSRRSRNAHAQRDSKGIHRANRAIQGSRSSGYSEACGTAQQARSDHHPTRQRTKRLETGIAAHLPDQSRSAFAGDRRRSPHQRIIGQTPRNPRTAPRPPGFLRSAFLEEETETHQDRGDGRYRGN